MSIPFVEENDQTQARREHLEEIRKLVGNVYPNKFDRSEIVEPGREDSITALVEKFRAYEPKAPAGGRPAPEEIELANQQLNAITLRVAGRIASPPRVMGKAAFVHLSDGVERLQLYVRQADIVGVSNLSAGETVDGWRLFSLLDHGDFIGVEGYLFITKTGELSIHVQKLQFLAKALVPLPDKMHGIHDPEIRQRQRYVDLIAGSLKIEREDNELTPREVFERRSAIIREMRRILDDHGYIEVETPMLTPLATGAAARPFKTHHNTLDIDLYARIAPELYLKRLLVGGFEKVYELNRNFRNEGISTRHNPEFTMLEFYWAYADVNQMMDFCEDMIRATVFKGLGHTHVRFGELDIDYSKPFQRLTMKEAISATLTSIDSRYRVLGGQEIHAAWLEDPELALALADFLIMMEQNAQPIYEIVEVGGKKSSQIIDQEPLTNSEIEEEWQRRLSNRKGTLPNDDPATPGRHVQTIVELFELIAEKNLIQPTFIYDYPKVISPLSKGSPYDPSIAERFELFIAGMEVANGFSELNDPVEQYDRFKDQVRQREGGDEEAMVMDEDYIRALSYGMPPAAGIGIGVDRLVMLLTNRQSIRDVILFPHMRPRKSAEAEEPVEMETGIENSGP
ncbi:MAG TPA: lysine--tRNA ligase [Pyrinomonadaceae bacterium]|nr:lysine--tRNA ligase [Pyrinomonadaceae bacterium]